MPLSLAFPCQHASHLGRRERSGAGQSCRGNVCLGKARFELSRISPTRLVKAMKQPVSDTRPLKFRVNNVRHLHLHDTHIPG